MCSLWISRRTPINPHTYRMQVVFSGKSGLAIFLMPQSGPNANHGNNETRRSQCQSPPPLITNSGQKPWSSPELTHATNQRETLEQVVGSRRGAGASHVRTRGGPRGPRARSGWRAGSWLPPRPPRPRPAPLPRRSRRRRLP